MSRRSRWIGVGCFLAAAAVALSAQPLWAQTVDGDIEELKRELRQAQEVLKSQQVVIEALQKRVGELEARQGQAPAQPAESPPPAPLQAMAAAKPQPPPFSVAWKDGKTTLTFPSAQLVFTNRIQTRYTYDDYQDPQQLNNGTFSIRRFKTAISGWAYTPDLTFRLQVGWEEANTSLGVLDDAWVQYDFTHGNRWFMLRAGQGKTPFSRQSIAPTGADMFTERSFVTYQFTSIRDVGLMASGQFGPASVKDLVEYEVGVFNGGGRSVFTNADGKYQTDFRVMVSPWGSAGYDEANPDGAPAPKLSLGIDYEHNDQRVRDPKTNAYKSGLEYATAGYDLMFKYRWFTAYGEYFDRHSHDVKDAAADSSGYNAQVGFLLIPRRLELVLGRWGYDPNADRPDDRQTQTGVGVNWYFNGFNNKLQADYRRVESDASRYRSYEFRLQYQLVF